MFLVRIVLHFEFVFSLNDLLVVTVQIFLSKYFTHALTLSFFYFISVSQVRVLSLQG
jgi:hypothetical protein